MKTYTVSQVAQLEAIAKDVIAQLEEMQRENGSRKRGDAGGQAAVLALHGDLGAGKTTFMQVLAQELGVAEQITSPTFVVMKKYDTDHGVFSELVHIDAYRIEDIDEMRPLRFAEELEQKGTIIGIEWAEKIAELLPPHTLHLTFTISGENRTVTLNGQES